MREYLAGSELGRFVGDVSNLAFDEKLMFQQMRMLIETAGSDDLLDATRFSRRHDPVDQGRIGSEQLNEPRKVVWLIVGFVTRATPAGAVSEMTSDMFGRKKAQKT